MKKKDRNSSKNKNKEGYADPTATTAIRNVEREHMSEARKQNGFLPQPFYETMKAARRALENQDYELIEIKAVDAFTGEEFVWRDVSRREVGRRRSNA